MLKCISRIWLIIFLRKDSYNNVNNWKNEIERYGDVNAKTVLIGNKTDLVDQRKIDYSIGQVI
jgi:hypothetical protein